MQFLKNRRKFLIRHTNKKGNAQSKKEYNNKQESKEKERKKSKKMTKGNINKWKTNEENAQR